MKTRKELKNIYKEKQSQMGVFQIKNITNGKLLVGNSLDLNAIWNRTKAELKFGTHANKILQKDWNELGEKRFVFEILAELERDDTRWREYRKEAKELETMFIKELEPFDEKGYNFKAGK